KPLLVRISGLKGAPASEHASERLLRFAPIRQSPVAITLAVALVISIPSDLNHKLLTVVALVGILSDAFVMFVGRAERSDRESATGTDSGVAAREALA